ncbi:hypothetical protein M378DRAFT_162576 [Amanita muscaria Koide BX008]|uniref:Uncharacterized protein n=1 Tax=Amanita muscaria (strain Koide BX008) TaxID=946122 RepID=A0A0C2WTI4_AMAMK|nr:hypothetical protein M378DRAFT_162576 [Amanita muscaria Koide BX008]
MSADYDDDHWPFSKLNCIFYIHGLKAKSMFIVPSRKALRRFNSRTSAQLVGS